MALNQSTWAKRVRLVCIASIASAFAAMAIPATVSSPAEAKTPGKTYCFVGKCHRVKTIDETKALVGVEQAITASHYDDCSKDRFNPCGLTSSGERFHPDRPDNTASPIYPDGTTLLVWSPQNKRALVVRVNNAGPYWGNRTLDLSRAAAEKLGFEGEGVADLKVRVVKAPEPKEAVYSENRDYPPVPGDIGQYASLDEAQRGMAVVLAFKATTGSPFAPVTTANAFSGQSIGSDMLVAEAPQAMGRALTVAYSRTTTSLALGGFTTKSHRNVAQSHGSVAMMDNRNVGNQTSWDEDRVVAEPAKVVAPVTETSSIVAEKAPEAKETAKARIAAAVYDEEPKPRKKRVARNRDRDDEDRSERRSSSRHQVASNEERPSRSYRAERDYDRPRVAYSGYGNGGDSEGRSAGQLMSDNLRPL